MDADICTVLRNRYPDQQQCACLTDWVSESLKAGNFCVVLSSLRQAVQQVGARAAETVLQLMVSRGGHEARSTAAAAQVDSIDALHCLLTCLLWCQHAVVTPVVQHLLLEAMPGDTAAAANHGSTPMATQLLLDYCSNSNGKLASKVSRALCAMQHGDE